MENQVHRLFRKYSLRRGRIAKGRGYAFTHKVTRRVTRAIRHLQSSKIGLIQTQRST